VAVPWLGYFLRDEPSGLDEMDAVVASSSMLTLDLSCALGIATQKFPSWQIYPNPTQGYGWIQNQSQGVLTFRAFNSLGQQVMSNVNVFPGGEIRAHFASGLYIVEACDENGNEQRQKWFVD
jgi:tricorn protease-like protein